MAQGKLSPRQRMINMMYLVLTALLALNVSKEIINAFVTVNESLEISKGNIDSKNQATYASFAVGMKNDAKKYGPANTSAQAIKAASDSLGKYIDDMKDLIIREADAKKAGEKTPALREMEAKEDYDTPTRLMCGEANDGTGAKATDLKNKIGVYKETVLKNLPAKDQPRFKKQLDDLMNTQDPASDSPEALEDGKRTWEMSKFYHNPSAATVALLTKFQGDVKNAESQVIDYLYRSVTSEVIAFDVLNAIVKTSSSYVLLGSEYSADVFIGASSSTMDPEVFIGASYDKATNSMVGGSKTPLPIDATTRMAKFSDRPGSEGEKKWSGVIRVKQNDNSYKYYPFEESYIAAKPNYTVSADYMNVLYIGPDNPITISVPGVPSEKVRPSAVGCGVELKPDLKLGKGHYLATVNSSGEVKVSVTAEINGKPTPMGQPYVFRVKKVPNPVATVNGTYHSGVINKEILAASNIIPTMEGFDFKLYYVVTGFKMSIIYKGGKDPLLDVPSDGNLVPDKMRSAIRALHPGDKVQFEYIKARMTTGTDVGSRNLEPLLFTIN